VDEQIQKRVLAALNRHDLDAIRSVEKE